MPTIPDDERKTIYADYRSALRSLRKDRDFLDWLKVARGYDEARREAMHRAGTNSPQGAAYREAFAMIDRREKLIHREIKHGKTVEFPSKEDRTYCIYVLENYDTPSHDPRRPSIKAWRDNMTISERAKLNHPKRVWQGYLEQTIPIEERRAWAAERERKAQERDDTPMQDLIADTERDRDDAHQHAQEGRALLGKVLELLGDDLPPELREAILRYLG